MIPVKQTSEKTSVLGEHQALANKAGFFDSIHSISCVFQRTEVMDNPIGISVVENEGNKWRDSLTENDGMIKAF